MSNNRSEKHKDNNLPLAGIKIIEFKGIGPGPFCGQHLRQLGAEVTLIDRPGSSGSAVLSGNDPMTKGKTIVEIDLKSPNAVEQVSELVRDADAIIEGLRPGVMERLGLGPEVLCKVNPRLVYGRITGWGQDGPLAHAAGHDLNYIALSGALWYGGQPGTAPITPPSIVGDIGGGALYLAIGILSGILQAQRTGKGKIVDAAMVDGSAHMMGLLLGLIPMGGLRPERGQSLLDGPNWYNTYVCKDGKYVTVGSLEPQFHAILIEKLGLSGQGLEAGQYNGKGWAPLREKFTDIFASRTQAEWCEIMEGTDICFAPVLDPWEAADHPHMAARGVYKKDKNGGLSVSPAPRFVDYPE